jgi:hypothetical protein
MSPFAWQEAARAQTLPWQLVEQHVLPDVHASPSVEQVEPLVPAGTAAQVPVLVQIVEQQSDPAAQPWPTEAHSLFPQ